MQIIQSRVEGTIQMNIIGRIDTNTSPKVQSDILIAFQKVNNLILNFQQVDYVSSAGLRALLIGQKTANSKRATMKLINVSPEVMSVLKMSGFSNILTIE